MKKESPMSWNRIPALHTLGLVGLGWCLLSGTGRAAPLEHQETPATMLLQEAAPETMSEGTAHDRFHLGQKNAAVGLGLWGGGLVVTAVGFVTILEATWGGQESYLVVGLATTAAGGGAFLGGPIVGGVGLNRSATALESLGADVDRKLTRFFWGSYVAQFIPYSPTALAVPILLAIERRKHRKIYEALEGG
jgi:hypothetical protein